MTCELIATSSTDSPFYIQYTSCHSQCISRLLFYQPSFPPVYFKITVLPALIPPSVFQDYCFTSPHSPQCISRLLFYQLQTLQSHISVVPVSGDMRNVMSLIMCFYLLYSCLDTSIVSGQLGIAVPGHFISNCSTAVPSNIFACGQSLVQLSQDTTWYSYPRTLTSWYI